MINPTIGSKILATWIPSSQPRQLGGEVPVGGSVWAASTTIRSQNRGCPNGTTTGGRVAPGALEIGGIRPPPKPYP